MNDADDSTVALWVAAGTGALVPLALGSGPLASAAGAVAPLAYTQVSGLARRILGRRFDNTQHCLNIAADLHEVGLDVFTEQLAQEDDTERIELTARVIEAAASASFPAKIQALGRVLADGVREDSNTAQALVLARAIGALDAAHVVVLHYVFHHPTPPDHLLGDEQKATVGWQASKLAQVLPEYDTVMDGLIATLSAQGLFRDASATNYASQTGEVTWVITAVGTLVLTCLPTG